MAVATQTQVTQVHTSAPCIYIRRGVTRKAVELIYHEIEPPVAIADHFNSLLMLFEDSLTQHLRQKKMRQYSFIIQQMMLGEINMPPSPWIVVSCGMRIIKIVKKWFRQDHLKQEYQPMPGSNHPRFDLAVINDPLLNLGGEQQSGPTQSQNSNSRLYGRSIINPSNGRTATLGGVIKIEWPNETPRLYWLTVGHNIDEPEDTCNLKDPPDSPTSSETEHASDSDGDEEGLDYVIKLPSSSQTPADLSPKTPPLAYSRAKRDQLLVHPCDRSGLDWSLIELATDAHIPFEVIPAHAHLDASDWYRYDPPGVDIEDLPGFSKHVEVCTETSGIVKGVLASTASLIKVPFTSDLTKTYVFRATSGTILQQGDCGAWVLGSTQPHDGRVFGHVVAASSLGFSFVVPIEAILARIRDTNNAAAAEIARRSDILVHAGPSNPSLTRRVDRVRKADNVPAPMQVKRANRGYVCGWNECRSVYSNLKHLNDHVAEQDHGPRRTLENVRKLQEEERARMSREKEQVRKRIREREERIHRRKKLEMYKIAEAQRSPELQDPTNLNHNTTSLFEADTTDYMPDLTSNDNFAF